MESDGNEYFSGPFRIKPSPGPFAVGGTKQRRAVSHFPLFEIQEEQGLAFLQTKLCVPVKINPKETPD